MAKLRNRLTAYIRMITIFIFLCGNFIVMVRSEDYVDGVDKTALKLPLSIDRYFLKNVLQLKTVNAITTLLDVQTPGMEPHRLNGERDTPTYKTEEQNNIQRIQEMARVYNTKKPRFICLHSHKSNAATFKAYINVWPESVTENMDLVFINAPFRVYSELDDNEYYEWFTTSKINTEYDNFEEGISYIEDRMIELGPFDGVLGFSQGAIVAGALPGMQRQGVCLTKVDKIKHVVIISGAKLGGKAFPEPKLAKKAYIDPINIPSLHIFGETDIARANAPELVEAYVDPLVIYHHGGHEVPALDEHGLKIMFEFLKRINAIV